LAYTVKTGLREGLRITWDWFRGRRDRWNMNG
jgi:hypothetical protein